MTYRKNIKQHINKDDVSASTLRHQITNIQYKRFNWRNGIGKQRPTELEAQTLSQEKKISKKSNGKRTSKNKSRKSQHNKNMQ